MCFEDNPVYESLEELEKENQETTWTNGDGNESSYTTQRVFNSAGDFALLTFDPGDGSYATATRQELWNQWHFGDHDTGETAEQQAMAYLAHDGYKFSFNPRTTKTEQRPTAVVDLAAQTVDGLTMNEWREIGHQNNLVQDGLVEGHVHPNLDGAEQLYHSKEEIDLLVSCDFVSLTESEQLAKLLYMLRIGAGALAS